MNLVMDELMALYVNPEQGRLKLETLRDQAQRRIDAATQARSVAEAAITAARAEGQPVDSSVRESFDLNGRILAEELLKLDHLEDSLAHFDEVAAHLSQFLNQTPKKVTP
jgi:hypothetical protein